MVQKYPEFSWKTSHTILLLNQGCHQLRVSAAFVRSDGSSCADAALHSLSLSLSLSLRRSSLPVCCAASSVHQSGGCRACVQRSGRTIWNLWRWGSGRGWKQSSERPAEMASDGQRSAQRHPDASRPAGAAQHTLMQRNCVLLKLTLSSSICSLRGTSERRWTWRDLKTWGSKRLSSNPQTAVCPETSVQ